MKKVLIGLLVSMPFFVLIAVNNLKLLLEWKVIIVFIMGIITSYYQADYNPFKVSNIETDKGSVLQIIWTVYLTQTLALLEAFYINPNRAFLMTKLSILFLIFAILGQFLRSWAYLTLGKFFTMHLETSTDQKVIENGPYLHLRHPSYTGAYITYICLPLFLGSYFSAILSALLLFWAFYRRINLEEKMLLTHLKEDYVRFCQSRARLIPFIW